MFFSVVAAVGARPELAEGTVADFDGITKLTKLTEFLRKSFG
jgi:hypothetical protein